MIKFTDVSFGFPQKDLYNEICFEIEQGDHAALIGSNGTGKSTLIDMIIHTDDYLYDGKIEKDENGKLIWVCPNCGNKNQDMMSVARRTCGYIGTQFWNQGRTQEIKERVLHL